MSKTTPTISKYMTDQPTTAESSTSLKEASDIMKSKQIRHLPVTDGGNLCGVVSDRDIRLALSIAGADPASMTLKNIQHPDVYSVDPDTPLDEVVGEMAEKHIGSAVIVQNGHIVGIFTGVDACLALKDVLEARFHSH